MRIKMYYKQDEAGDGTIYGPVTVIDVAALTALDVALEYDEKEHTDVVWVALDKYRHMTPEQIKEDGERYKHPPFVSEEREVELNAEV